MSIRTVHLTTLAAAALLFGGHAHAQRSAGPVAVSVTPDTVRAEGVKRSRTLKTDAQRKVLAALSADPRYASLQKELAEAAKISDETQQLQKLRSIATRAQAVRNDAVRRAGVDVRAIESEVLTARKPPPPALPQPVPFHPPALPGATPPPAPAPPLTVTSFTEIDTRKIECPDAGDTWSFNGNKSHYDASSGPTDHDCAWIRAAKGAFIDVPAGTKHVALTVKLDYSLKTLAASFGIWASAWSEVGLRVENMNGTPIDTIKLGNTNVPTSTSFCWVKGIDSSQGPDVVPLRDSGDQGLNTKVTCSFAVDPRGGKMMIAPYVGGGVDADLSGYARSFGTVTPHSVEAVFSK